MHKNTVLTKALISVLTFSALVGVQLVSLATANPGPYTNYPPTPNKDLPILAIQSPANATYWNMNDITLQLTITKPDSWNESNWIRKVIYQPDGQAVILWDGNRRTHYGNPVVDYILPHTSQFSTILNASKGKHILQVNVTAESPYNPPPYPSDWWWPQKYTLVASQTILFTVNAEDAVPEFPSWASMLTIFAVSAVAVAVYKRRLARTSIR